MTAPALTITGPRRPTAGSQAGVVRTPRHEYFFNGAGPWPGVTTITDVLDKPALVRWKREQVALAAIGHLDWLVANRDTGNEEATVAYLLAARNEGTTGRERGSRIHAKLESILRREPVTVDPRDAPAIEGARAWLNQHAVRPIQVEAYLINETLGYGGTCDLVAEIDGVIWLLDWKTSKSVAWPNGRVYDEMRLQLVAYARSEFVALPNDEQRHPMPAIARCGIVHVTDQGTRLYPADPTEDDWTTFRACLWIHGWKARQ